MRHAEGASRREFLRGRTRHARPSTAQIAETCLARRGVACQSCRDICPAGAIAFPPRLGGVALPLVRPETCTGCGECTTVCPVAAISVGEPAEACGGG